MHGSADGGEIIEVEKIALADQTVKKELAKLELPDGAVVVSDPWTYGDYALSRVY